MFSYMPRPHTDKFLKRNYSTYKSKLPLPHGELIMFLLIFDFQRAVLRCCLQVFCLSKKSYTHRALHSSFRIVTMSSISKIPETVNRAVQDTVMSE
jgi:hypothetical protein